MKKTFSQHKQFICPLCGADLKEEGFSENSNRNQHTEYGYNENDKCFYIGDYDNDDEEYTYYCNACSEDITTHINYNWNDLVG